MHEASFSIIVLFRWMILGPAHCVGCWTLSSRILWNNLGVSTTWNDVAPPSWPCIVSCPRIERCKLRSSSEGKVARHRRAFWFRKGIIVRGCDGPVSHQVAVFLSVSECRFEAEFLRVWETLPPLSVHSRRDRLCLLQPVVEITEYLKMLQKATTLPLLEKVAVVHSLLVGVTSPFFSRSLALSCFCTSAELHQVHLLRVVL